MICSVDAEIYGSVAGDMLGKSVAFVGDLDGDDCAETVTGADGKEKKFSGDVIDSQTAKVASDGTLTGIRFEVEPESVGRRRPA